MVGWVGEAEGRVAWLGGWVGLRVGQGGMV